MSPAVPPVPTTTVERGGAYAQSRYATADPARALDIITSYDAETKTYVSMVRAVHFLEVGTAFTHARDAELAGYTPNRTDPVARDTRDGLLGSDLLARLAFAPQIHRMLLWATNPKKYTPVDVARPAAAAHVEAMVSRTDSTALKALNIAREAFDDAGHSVSPPGQAEPGEFYVEIDGVNLAVRIETI